MYAQRTPVSLASLFTGAKEANFLTLAKENHSHLGLYQTPPTFSFTNPIFMLLICDRSFVLLSLLRTSTFVTNHRCMPTSYSISLERLPPTTVSGSERKVFIADC